MIIQTISDPITKKTIARGVLESLTEWFGIVDAREKYISESADLVFIGAFEGQRPVGFLTLKKTGKDTVELHVMGVLKEHQHQGVGKALIGQAKTIAISQGYSFLQVKTVQMGKYPEYDQTNRFYLSCGFKEFEVFPALWDAWNPCQIYVMALRCDHD
jgi:GNAT superfamily N-acetyltransferase